MRVKFVADLFNVFNEQKVIRVNQLVTAATARRNESGFPEAGSSGIQFRAIRTRIRLTPVLAVRFEF